MEHPTDSQLCYPLWRWDSTATPMAGESKQSVSRYLVPSENYKPNNDVEHKNTDTQARRYYYLVLQGEYRVAWRGRQPRGATLIYFALPRLSGARTASTLSWKSPPSLSLAGIQTDVRFASDGQTS
ncbi:hypothetical protein MAPG_07861 [Magnaporthiopsis poae ATCC 64411]|uniref:Uncharacterized protein n=1 Tax=Magnaporthiopsis poae (strain ATCC 64411 / 73-15) TaxID=644358 RepID=A0A0C4E5T6_MAGP6|nr:hypothetical protein MAPG_07861 [Magnaporthiopsis poae ATCC 64411]